MTDKEIVEKIKAAEDAVATSIAAAADMAKKQSPGLSDTQAFFCGIMREFAIVRVRLDQLEKLVELGLGNVRPEDIEEALRKPDG